MAFSFRVSQQQLKASTWSSKPHGWSSRFGRAPASRKNEFIWPQFAQSGSGKLPGLLEDVDGPDFVAAVGHPVPEPARSSVSNPDPDSADRTAEATLSGK